MFDVRVERVLDKNIDAVFELLTDHENYTRFKGITESELLEQGNTEKNGEGALRKIVGGPNQLLERITRFERPTRMDYRIEKSSPLPMRHDVGEITLEAIGDKTKVVWVSQGHITIPVLGNLILDKSIEKQVIKMFNAMLKTIERS
jgi:uncharacterized protein YndB with AHSA1/START domain